MSTVTEVSNRQSLIAAITNQHGRCTVSDLANRFNVTAETIRRDLKLLETNGMLRRVHGGAVSGSSTKPSELRAVDEYDDLPIQQSQRRKNSIAQIGVTFIPGPNAAMFIDAGSTTEAFAQRLARTYVGQQWNIVTNSPNIAHTLASAGVSSVTILGGIVKPRTQAIVGPQAVNELQRLRADIAFMGTNGLSIAHGLSTSDPREATIKSLMIKQAKYSVVLCDSTKINRESAVSFAGLSEIDTVVSDRQAPEDFSQKLCPFNTRMVIP